MNILQLRDTLRQAEQAYTKAKTSLDGSIELILAKEALKDARFNYAEAAIEFYEETLASDSPKEQPERVWCGTCENHVEDVCGSSCGILNIGAEIK